MVDAELVEALKSSRSQMRKFKRYILNHPPTTKGGSFSGNKNVDKKEAAVKNKVAKAEKAEKAEKEEKEAQEKPLKKEKSQEEEPIVWYSDTSEEAARARRGLMIPDALLKTKKAPSVAEVKDLLGSPDKLQELKNSSGLSDMEFVPILFDAMVPKESTNLSALAKQKAIIRKFVGSSEAQVTLLRCIEKFAGEVQTSLLTKVSHIIKELYDEELLEEESVFAWADDSTNAVAKVREQAAPIVKWLREAEEESGSDEEGDE